MPRTHPLECWLRSGGSGQKQIHPCQDGFWGFSSGTGLEANLPIEAKDANSCTWWFGRQSNWCEVIVPGVSIERAAIDLICIPVQFLAKHLDA